MDRLLLYSPVSIVHLLGLDDLINVMIVIRIWSWWHHVTRGNSTHLQFLNSNHYYDHLYQICDSFMTNELKMRQGQWLHWLEIHYFRYSYLHPSQTQGSEEPPCGPTCLGWSLCIEHNLLWNYTMHGTVGHFKTVFRVVDSGSSSIA